jgi:hypothetical protein
MSVCLKAVDKTHQTKRRGTGFVFDESAEETEKQKKGKGSYLINPCGKVTN